MPAMYPVAKLSLPENIMGKVIADVAQQYIKAGLLDEIQIHLVPVLLGDGTRLFEHLGSSHIELESTRVLDSAGVTHLQYRVTK